MSARAVVFDPARELKMYFRVGRDGSRVLTFRNPDGSPFDIQSRAPEVVIYHSETSSAVVYEPTVSFPAAHRMQIDQDADDTANIRPRIYFVEITVDGGAKTWITGDAIFHEGKFDGVDTTATLTISPDALDGITITVEDTSSTAVEALADQVTALQTVEIQQLTNPSVITPAVNTRKRIFLITATTSLSLTFNLSDSIYNNGDEFLINVLNGASAPVSIDFPNQISGGIYNTTRKTFSVAPNQYVQFRLVYLLGYVSFDQPLSGRAVLSSDTATTSTSYQDTGLQLTNQFGAGATNMCIKFRAVICYNSSSAATGSKWGISSGSTLVKLRMKVTNTLTATSETINFVGADDASGDDKPTAANASSLLIGNVAILEGVVQCGNTSNPIKFRFASEDGGTITCLRGMSYVDWEIIDHK